MAAMAAGVLKAIETRYEETNWPAERSRARAASGCKALAIHQGSREHAKGCPVAPRRTPANASCCLARATAKSSGLQPLRRPSMEFKTAEAQRDELLQRARRKGLPIRTGQRRAMAEPAWLHDADLAAQKYTEAVAVAVEKCARDTAGQTCYICGEDSTGTLVRGCACRGTAGLAHVSCLAYQARSLVDFRCG